MLVFILGMIAILTWVPALIALVVIMLVVRPKRRKSVRKPAPLVMHHLRRPER